jgi:PrgI family protein
MTHPVRIPADLDREDRVLGRFTARQTVIGAVTALTLYGGWVAVGRLLPLAVFALAALPVVAVAAAVAVGRREGLPLERWLVAAARHHLAPTARLDPHLLDPGRSRPSTGGERFERWRAGPQLPVRGVRAGVSGAGLVDLGPDGVALIAEASTINLRLRTGHEQDGLVAGFARYLHSLTAGVQILVRAQPMDLSAYVSELRAAAAALPHPALAAAAAAHADDLSALSQVDRTTIDPESAVDPDPDFGSAPHGYRDPGGGTPGNWTPAGDDATVGPRTGDAEDAETGWDEGGWDEGSGDGGRVELLSRQVLLVWREPHRRPAGRTRLAEQRLTRRYTEAAALLAPVGITLTVLDPAAARTVLTDALLREALLPDPGHSAVVPCGVTTSGVTTSGVTTSDVLPGDAVETDVVSATAVPAAAVPTRRGAPVGGAVPAATTRHPEPRPAARPHTSRPEPDPARNLVWPPPIDGTGWDGWSEPFPGSDADLLDLPTVPPDVAGATRQGWPA